MFKDFEDNFNLLKKRDTIPVEELLDSMCRLFDGAEKVGTEVRDTAAYGDAITNLFDRLSPSYRQIKPQLRQLGDCDVDEVAAQSEKIAAELASLRVRRDKLAECRTAREEKLKLQAEVDQLQGEADAMERLKQREAELEKISTESSAALFAIKNAWESVRLREDLPDSFRVFKEFDRVPLDIDSFSSLEKWFDDTGAGLEKVLSAYIQMYKKICSVLMKTVE